MVPIRISSIAAGATTSGEPGRRKEHSSASQSMCHERAGATCMSTRSNMQEHVQYSRARAIDAHEKQHTRARAIQGNTAPQVMQVGIYHKRHASRRTAKEGKRRRRKQKSKPAKPRKRRGRRGTRREGKGREGKGREGKGRKGREPPSPPPTPTTSSKVI